MAESKGTDFFRMGKQSMAGQLGGTKGDPLNGLDQVTVALRAKKLARETENKAIKAEEAKARKLGGQKISNGFAEMGPTLKALGPESFGKAQEEVEALRQEMFAAIDAKDQKKIGELNMRLSEIKGRHATDAENLSTLVESWEDETVSTDAMTDEDMKVMEHFQSNPTKKVVYEGNTMMYEWDTDEPLMDETTGEQQIDKEGNPMFIKDRKSMEQLQDMIITKETENGVKMLDYGEELKQNFKDGDFPTDAQLKSKVKDIIPQDAKQLRDWLHGNPAEQDGLNVHKYLTDLMSVNGDFNTFASLGVDTSQFEDTNDIEGIQADEIPDEFKEDLIAKIMNVEDMEKSHGIISDIYANILRNNGMGKVYNEETGEGNKDYRTQEEISILGSKSNSSTEAKAKRAEALTKLQSLGDKNSPIFKEISAMDDKEIATYLGFENLQSQIYNDATKEMESISHYIASAKNKTATGKIAPKGLSGKEKIEWYKNN